MAAPEVKGALTAMPQIAFGLYLVPQEETRACVRSALEAGYRHFDSASFYNNEAEAGAELRQWLSEGHERSELFVTTKVWTTDLGSPEACLRSAEISISELDIEYVDCLMVHWPMPGKHVDAYLALEPLVKSGRAKSLGISNYTPQDYEELLPKVSVPPAVNTFEVNPLLYRKEWIDYFQSKGLVVQAYKPLQRGGATLQADPVTEIATRLDKSPGQVCIRWAVEKGLVVLVKSSKPERQKENLSVSDFKLSAEDIAKLDALTTKDAIETAAGHYDKRRNGTPAPWGEGPRPEKRIV
eukprot:TRINITY_DN33621_c0_g1_i1.p1 TRINITY_DN33621_c0_g1~~TRINITY_DN33621_c0_g1_i1.p1  ORF type:complete len:321 (+),score=59.17 TRINITY_DN33621_c0_g1_i1:73-963(+)